MKLETKGNLQLLLSRGGGTGQKHSAPAHLFPITKPEPCMNKREPLPPTQGTAHVLRGAQGADAGGPGLACKDVVRF